MTDSVRLCVEDRVATITLNRPAHRNTADPAMLDALLGAQCKARADNTIRAVIRTGAGDPFCAGADPRPAGPSQPPADGSPGQGVKWFLQQLAAEARWQAPLVDRPSCREGVAAPLEKRPIRFDHITDRGEESDEVHR